MTTQIPDDDSITSLTTQDQLIQLQYRHEAQIIHLHNNIDDAEETHKDQLRDLQSNYKEQSLRDLQVVYLELDTVKATLSFRSGQLLHAREDIRALTNMTPPPFSIATGPRTLQLLIRFDLRPSSSPSDPPPPPYRAWYTVSFNPVPYSTTIQIVEENYNLHKEYLHRRVGAPNSNLDIVYQYHHLLDATVNLPPDPNHH